jgi:UMF1 family MFS transporter
MRLINRTQWAWAFNDWANSAFATTVLVAMFPALFKDYYAAGMPGTESTFYFSVFGNSLSALLVVFLAPTLGALADRRGRRKVFLGAFTVLGAGATFGLCFVGKGEWPLAIGLFTLASIGFFGSLGFYDSLLLNVAAPVERDRVSAVGYGLGYLGGGVLLAVNVWMALQPQRFGFGDTVTATKFAFGTVAVWWLVFSIPLFLRVPESAPSDAGGAMGWVELRRMLARVFQLKPVMMFLFAYWLYIDALGTVAQLAVDFGKNLGFSTAALIKAILLVQFVSFPAAIAFGWIGERLGARNGIYLGLAVYVGVTLWAWFMKTEADFYLMAAVVGLVQGGVQSLSRSYYARLIPQDAAGEFFGFYNMLGKFAAVLGPLVVGVTSATTGNARLALFMLVFFFLGGALLLSRVREETPTPT